MPFAAGNAALRTWALILARGEHVFTLGRFLLWREIRVIQRVADRCGGRNLYMSA